MAAPAIPSEPEAPAMSKASLTITPEKPSSPRSSWCSTVELIVAGWSRSSCGTMMWAVMITRQPASMAAANGTSSRRRNWSRDLSTAGSETCESRAVSPCPGKCFALAATPVDCRPATHARPCRATRSASLEKLRTPLTGLSARELTSTQGAKLTVQPACRSDQPIAAAVARVVSRSSSRPSTALPGNGAPVAAKSRVTSPPSSSMAMIAYGFSAMMASVSLRSCPGEEMFCANRQTPARPARSRSRSQTGRVVPANPGSMVACTLKPLPARLALKGLDVVRGELKTGSRGRVEQDGDVRMQLKRCGGPHRGHGSFDELVDRLCFSSPRGHEHDVAGLEDGPDALGQAVWRYRIHVATEESSVVPAGLAGPGLDPRAGDERGARFVECDMPVGADPQNLEVNAAGVRNGPFVHLARSHQVRGQSVGPRHPSRIDIDLVNELVSDDAEVPLRMVLRQADILVEHERSRLRERHRTLHHSAAEFVVDQQGT